MARIRVGVVGQQCPTPTAHLIAPLLSTPTREPPKLKKFISEVLEIKKIPSWIKIITSWWIADQIDDESFFKILEFLTQKQIIPI